MRVQGKVVVVTGAGSGIGRSVALEALARGARVAAVDLNETTLKETATLAPIEERVTTHVLDITDPSSVATLPAGIAEQHGSVDALIHCAGIIQPFTKVAELDDAAIQRVFDVNWWGTVHLTRAFLPVFFDRPTAHIVHVSSMGGFLPVPGQTIYGASKAAVKLFTEGLHAECSGTNVRVTVVFPGAVATNITANSGVEIPSMASAKAHRTTSADDAARMILDGMESDAYRVLVGRDAKIMDALYRLSPRRAAALITRQMQDLLRS
ncbi:MAG TPA: SDR family oxidoreductase [Egibacteraceae bacterium]|nr:SDR family oxidoreductase [Egibacteraceae bacterium]